MNKLEAIGIVRKYIVFAAVLLIWMFVATSCGPLGQTNTVGNTTPANGESASLSPSSQKGERDLEKDVRNAKADNYYEVQFVEKYVERMTYAINTNDFKLLKDMLVQDSSLYFLEKKFMEENYNKGVTYRLIYFSADDIKKNNAKKEYELFATIEFEITNPHGTKETKILQKIYTVCDDNNVKKIVDIKANNASITKVHSVSTDEIVSYFALSKDEILKKLGLDYRVIPTGAEGLCQGYHYKDMGLTFVFESNNTVSFIECDDEVEINGARAGMNFVQIQEELGETKIEDTWIETPEHKAYEISYTIDNCVFNFMSFKKDGSNSHLTVYRKRQPQKNDGEAATVNQDVVGSSLTHNNSQIIPTSPKSKEGENTRGNTLGNIVNLGVAAIQGDWIYYLNEDRSDTKGGSLYRVNIHDGNKEKICDDAAHDINVLGEWIYFSNHTESKGFVSGPIYKIKADGTNRTKINNDEAQFINVIDDWIYYISKSDERRIYRMKTDGTGLKKLNDENSGSLNVVEGWIYYTSNGNIYKMKTDGSDKKLIQTGDILVLIVDGEWIYYSQGDKGNIYKIKLDGSEKTQVTEDITNQFNIAGGYIYYSKEVDTRKYYIYRVDLDGKNKKIIARGGVDSIVGNWSYFYSYYAEWAELERIKLDGAGHEKVSNGKAIDL